ncbi:MAG TPA: hypothetical protein VJX67_05590, partial [Blastocatellia bacterium]|nr:hypothetical protein [Blastocatellia bacterium]
SIARLLDERATSNALAILAQAAEYLKARSDELGRIYYLATSFAETIAVLLTVLLLWVIRAPIASLFGSPDAIDIMVGAGMGSLGAFVSILQRSNKLNINSSAGWPVYVVEATVRALTGAVGGVLVAIAIRSHFILNQINGSDRPLLILMLFCVAAGSSERIVPNLMHQVQGVLGKAKGAVPGDKADSSSSDVESTQEEGGSDEDNPTETETGKQKAQASNDVSNGNERTFELVVTVRERLARPDLRPAEPEGEGDAEPDVEPKEEDLAYSEDRRSESGQAGVKDTNEERPAVTSTAPQGPSPGGQSSEP